MSVLRPTASARGRRRRAPRPLNAALAELLRAWRPPTSGDDEHVWICLTPASAAAIARISARRAGSIEHYREHRAHQAVQAPLGVCAATAAEWRRDAWQAVGEGLIGADDALLLSAQIDSPGAA